MEAINSGTSAVQNYQMGGFGRALDAQTRATGEHFKLRNTEGVESTMGVG